MEAPPSFVPKARYALEMLLMPLGIAPVWVGRGELAGAGLYYGPAGEGLPSSVVRAPLREETLAYFDSGEPYRAERVRWVEWEEEPWPVLFGGARTGEEDLLASAFFWLSGWQETTIRERDRHGRFPHRVSLQARLGTTARPAVDACREMLAGRLVAAGVPVRRRTWGGRAWALCPTHDVDYLRKWRPGLVRREVVHHLMMNHRREDAAARLRRFGRFLADALRPGDVYRRAFERMQAETARRGGTATFFLKAGAHGPHDVPYRLDGRYLRRRLDALAAAGFEVGLHPSYHAYRHPGYLCEERDRLAAVTGRVPASVRQHYLRFEAPATPRLHHRLGFRIDSTLGFAEHEGFRHGTCHPFRYFDLLENRPLDVWEMPLMLMDSTLFNLRKLDAEKARAVTGDLLDTCRRFGGAAVCLWHNTLWDELDCPGWGRHFLDTLDAAVAGGAYVASLSDALAAFRA